MPRGAASNSSYDYFAPTYALAVDMTDAFDLNSPQYLETVRKRAVAIVSRQADSLPVSVYQPCSIFEPLLHAEQHRVSTHHAWLQATKRQRQLEDGAQVNTAVTSSTGGETSETVTSEVERRLDEWVATKHAEIDRMDTLSRELVDEQREKIRVEVLEEQSATAAPTAAPIETVNAHSSAATGEMATRTNAAAQQKVAGSSIVGARLPDKSQRPSTTPYTAASAQAKGASASV
eukprot:SAG31_NODE_6460_length_2008_cov_2.676794_2_plen_233_part_00